MNVSIPHKFRKTLYVCNVQLKVVTLLSRAATDSCRGDIKLYGWPARLILGTSTPKPAAAGEHGPWQLQHRPLPAGSHPTTDAW